MVEMYLIVEINYSYFIGMMVGMSAGTILIDNKTLVNFLNDLLPHSLCVCVCVLSANVM